MHDFSQCDISFHCDAKHEARPPNLSRNIFFRSLENYGRRRRFTFGKTNIWVFKVPGRVITAIKVNWKRSLRFPIPKPWPFVHLRPREFRLPHHWGEQHFFLSANWEMIREFTQLVFGNWSETFIPRLMKQQIADPVIKSNPVLLREALKTVWDEWTVGLSRAFQSNWKATRKAICSWMRMAYGSQSATSHRRYRFRKVTRAMHSLSITRLDRSRIRNVTYKGIICCPRSYRGIANKRIRLLLSLVSFLDFVGTQSEFHDGESN